MNNRAWSLLEIKSVDDDQRIITGIATTPEMDRVGDIVEPMGASYAREIPLLWQHRHDEPVGYAELAKATKSGIPFKAWVANIGEPGPMKELADKAWQAVKNRLVRGVSIGFRAKKYDRMPDGGLRFTETQIYELSLVTIPANASASIQTIKSFDAGFHRVNGGIPLIAAQKAERPKGYVQLVTAEKRR